MGNRKLEILDDIRIVERQLLSMKIVKSDKELLKEANEELARLREYYGGNG